MAGAGRGYLSAARAHGAARGQLAFYEALARQGHSASFATRPASTHTAAWHTWDAAPAASDAPPRGVVLSMESADAILEPDDLADWHAAGVRVIGPTH